jgi:hypothetical protein
MLKRVGAIQIPGAFAMVIGFEPSYQWRCLPQSIFFGCYFLIAKPQIGHYDFQGDLA